MTEHTDLTATAARLYEDIAQDTAALRAIADEYETTTDAALFLLVAYSVRAVTGATTDEAVAATRAHIESVADSREFRDAVFAEVRGRLGV